MKKIILNNLSSSNPEVVTLGSQLSGWNCISKSDSNVLLFARLESTNEQFQLESKITERQKITIFKSSAAPGASENNEDGHEREQTEECLTTCQEINVSNEVLFTSILKPKENRVVLNANKLGEEATFNLSNSETDRDINLTWPDYSNDRGNVEQGVEGYGINRAPKPTCNEGVVKKPSDEILFQGYTHPDCNNIKDKSLNFFNLKKNKNKSIGTCTEKYKSTDDELITSNEGNRHQLNLTNDVELVCSSNFTDQDKSICLIPRTNLDDISSETQCDTKLYIGNSSFEAILDEVCAWSKTKNMGKKLPDNLSFKGILDEVHDWSKCTDSDERYEQFGKVVNNKRELENLIATLTHPYNLSDQCFENQSNDLISETSLSHDVIYKSNKNGKQVEERIECKNVSNRNIMESDNSGEYIQRSINQSCFSKNIEISQKVGKENICHNEKTRTRKSCNVYAEPTHILPPPKQKELKRKNVIDEPFEPVQCYPHQLTDQEQRTPPHCGTSNTINNEKEVWAKCFKPTINLSNKGHEGDQRNRDPPVCCNKSKESPMLDPCATCKRVTFTDPNQSAENFRSENESGSEITHVWENHMDSLESTCISIPEKCPSNENNTMLKNKNNASDVLEMHGWTKCASPIKMRNQETPTWAVCLEPEPPKQSSDFVVQGAHRWVDSNGRGWVDSKGRRWIDSNGRGWIDNNGRGWVDSNGCGRTDKNRHGWSSNANGNNNGPRENEYSQDTLARHAWRRCSNDIIQYDVDYFEHDIPPWQNNYDNSSDSMLNMKKHNSSYIYSHVPANVSIRNRDKHKGSKVCYDPTERPSASSPCFQIKSFRLVSDSSLECVNPPGKVRTKGIRCGEREREKCHNFQDTRMKNNGCRPRNDCQQRYRRQDQPSKFKGNSQFTVDFQPKVKPPCYPANGNPTKLPAQSNVTKKTRNQEIPIWRKGKNIAQVSSTVCRDSSYGRNIEKRECLNGEPKRKRSPCGTKSLPAYSVCDIANIDWEAYLPDFDRGRDLGCLLKAIGVVLKDLIKIGDGKLKCTCQGKCSKPYLYLSPVFLLRVIQTKKESIIVDNLIKDYADKSIECLILIKETECREECKEAEKGCLDEMNKAEKEVCDKFTTAAEIGAYAVPLNLNDKEDKGVNTEKLNNPLELMFGCTPDKLVKADKNQITPKYIIETIENFEWEPYIPGFNKDKDLPALLEVISTKLNDIFVFSGNSCLCNLPEMTVELTSAQLIHLLTSSLKKVNTLKKANYCCENSVTAYPVCTDISKPGVVEECINSCEEIAKSTEEQSRSCSSTLDQTPNCEESMNSFEITESMFCSEILEIAKSITTDSKHSTCETELAQRDKKTQRGKYCYKLKRTKTLPHFHTSKNKRTKRLDSCADSRVSENSASNENSNSNICLKCCCKEARKKLHPCHDDSEMPRSISNVNTEALVCKKRRNNKSGACSDKSETPQYFISDTTTEAIVCKKIKNKSDPLVDNSETPQYSSSDMNNQAVVSKKKKKRDIHFNQSETPQYRVSNAKTEAVVRKKRKIKSGAFVDKSAMPQYDNSHDKTEANVSKKRKKKVGPCVDKNGMPQYSISDVITESNVCCCCQRTKKKSHCVDKSEKSQCSVSDVITNKPAKRCHCFKGLKNSGPCSTKGHQYSASGDVDKAHKRCHCFKEVKLNAHMGEMPLETPMYSTSDVMNIKWEYYIQGFNRKKDMQFLIKAIRTKLKGIIKLTKDQKGCNCTLRLPHFFSCLDASYLLDVIQCNIEPCKKVDSGQNIATPSACNIQPIFTLSEHEDRLKRIENLLMKKMIRLYTDKSMLENCGFSDERDSYAGKLEYYTKKYNRKGNFVKKHLSIVARNICPPQERFFQSFYKRKNKNLPKCRDHFIVEESDDEEESEDDDDDDDDEFISFPSKSSLSQVYPEEKKSKSWRYLTEFEPESESKPESKEKNLIVCDEYRSKKDQSELHFKLTKPTLLKEKPSKPPSSIASHPLNKVTYKIKPAYKGTITIKHKPKKKNKDLRRIASKVKSKPPVKKLSSKSKLKGIDDGTFKYTLYPSKDNMPTSSRKDNNFKIIVKPRNEGYKGTKNFVRKENTDQTIVAKPNPSNGPIPRMNVTLKPTKLQTDPLKVQQTQNNSQNKKLVQQTTNFSQNKKPVVKPDSSNSRPNKIEAKVQDGKKIRFT